MQDDIQFGLKAGGQLDVNTTVCIEARAARKPVVIDHASGDPVYCNHHAAPLRNIELHLGADRALDGEYFGNLCAIDPRPRVVSDPRTVTMFTLFAELIAPQLESEGGNWRPNRALVNERAGSSCASSSSRCSATTSQSACRRQRERRAARAAQPGAGR